MLILLSTLSVFLSAHVEATWACAGNSYMAITGDFDRTQCDGWLVVDGEPVVHFWQGKVAYDE